MISKVWGDKDFPVTQGFSSTHKAIDVSMPIGTPLYAPERSYIVNLKDQYGGLYQSLRFEDGRQLIIVHLSKGVASGWTLKGSFIAYSGNSGRSTNPHSHLELRRQSGVPSSAIDPTNYLKGGDMVTKEELNLIYWQVLHRQVDPSGEATYVGKPLIEVLRSLDISEEYRSVEKVFSFGKETIKRAKEIN